MRYIVSGVETLSILIFTLFFAFEASAKAPYKILARPPRSSIRPTLQRNKLKAQPRHPASRTNTRPYGTTTVDTNHKEDPSDQYLADKSTEDVAILGSPSSELSQVLPGKSQGNDSPELNIASDNYNPIVVYATDPLSGVEPPQEQSCVKSNTFTIADYDRFLITLDRMKELFRATKQGRMSNYNESCMMGVAGPSPHAQAGFLHALMITRDSAGSDDQGSKDESYRKTGETHHSKEVNNEKDKFGTLSDDDRWILLTILATLATCGSSFWEDVTKYAAQTVAASPELSKSIRSLAKEITKALEKAAFTSEIIDCLYASSKIALPQNRLIEIFATAGLGVRLKYAHSKIDQQASNEERQDASSGAATTKAAVESAPSSDIAQLDSVRKKALSDLLSTILARGIIQNGSSFPEKLNTWLKLKFSKQKENALSNTIEVAEGPLQEKLSQGLYHLLEKTSHSPKKPIKQQEIDQDLIHLRSEPFDEIQKLLTPSTPKTSKVISTKVSKRQLDQWLTSHHDGFSLAAKILKILLSLGFDRSTEYYISIGSAPNFDIFLNIKDGDSIRRLRLVSSKDQLQSEHDRLEPELITFIQKNYLKHLQHRD